MCGICGFSDRRGALDDPDGVLRKMNATFAHRGPDDEGYARSGPIALAMRRLSIIDLDGGHQPMSNEDGRIRVVFNGAIYNFKELRRELKKSGHVFRTRSDTEVIPHAYEEWGPDCVRHLDGMFAFALHDTKTGRLMLARDRTGKKPLYHAEVAGHFVFGSELKALLMHPAVGRQIDPVALQQYLLFGCVITPRSIFSDIRKLPEAHYLLVDGGAVGPPMRYWKYTFASRPENRPLDEWVESTDRVLREAVRRRLEADVPLGLFLSGGVDSSLVMAEMCQLMPASRVKTFSIAMDDPDYDESRWSRAAAQRMGTEHTEFRLKLTSIRAEIENVLDNLDEPLADSAVVPFYVVSSLARKHVKVALAGDGGDELFGGYPKYAAHRWAALAGRMPRWFRRLLQSGLSRLPERRGSVLLNRSKLIRFLASLDQPIEIRNQLWVSQFQPPAIDRLTGRPMDEHVFEPVRQRMAEYEGPDDVVSKAMYLDFVLLMQDAFNVKADRASMMASLEIREPFLDTAMIELAAQMPSSAKIKGFETKLVLKELACRYYPREFVYRKKWGFGLPLAAWFSGELGDRFLEEACGNDGGLAGLVDADACRHLLSEHRSGTSNNSAGLWTLYALARWQRRWAEPARCHMA